MKTLSPVLLPALLLSALAVGHPARAEYTPSRMQEEPAETIPESAPRWVDGDEECFPRGGSDSDVFAADMAYQLAVKNAIHKFGSAAISQSTVENFQLRYDKIDFASAGVLTDVVEHKSQRDRYFCNRVSGNVNTRLLNQVIGELLAKIRREKEQDRAGVQVKKNMLELIPLGPYDTALNFCSIEIVAIDMSERAIHIDNGARDRNGNPCPVADHGFLRQVCKDDSAKGCFDSTPKNFRPYVHFVPPDIIRFTSDEDGASKNSLIYKLRAKPK